MSRWTKKRVVELKKFWLRGMSASDIARQWKDGTTRNSVISKLHREGLTHRENKTSKQKAAIARRNGARARQAMFNVPSSPQKSRVENAINHIKTEVIEPSKEELVIPLAERKTIATLENNHCKWPIGDPQEPNFHFCGKERVPATPYCIVHCQRAYQPPQPKKEKKKAPEKLPVNQELDVGNRFMKEVVDA